MASTVWKGQLTFGLVSFPVRLQKAARKERVPLKYVREVKRPAEPLVEDPELEAEPEPEPEIAPVRQAYVSADAEEPSPARELSRAFEVAPEQFAVIRPEEIRKLRAATSPDLQILRSVKLDEIDPVFFETSYNVVPDANGERPYVLLYRALQQTGYAALAQIAMHGREHIMIVRAASRGLMAHTMFYINEVRESEEFTAEVVEKELNLAKRFVEAIAEPFRPEEFTDRYREQLEALIASKNVTRQTAAVTAAANEPGKVIDIMEALRKSLESASASRRKPVSRAPAAEQKARKRKA